MKANKRLLTDTLSKQKCPIKTSVKERGIPLLILILILKRLFYDLIPGWRRKVEGTRAQPTKVHRQH